ncbi:MAG: hypothetical protein L3J02_02980 [Henriciella sp.]|nr:hypothetical protein [Henriciella sp.]
MRKLILSALFAISPLAAAQAANAGEVRVYIDVEQATSAAKMDTPTAGALAAISAARDNLDASEKALKTATETLATQALFMTNQQRSARETQLESQKSSILQQRQNLKTREQELHTDTRARAEIALQSGLSAYLEVNRVDTIRPFTGSGGGVDFIILNEAYNITAPVARLMAGGRSNTVPPAPKTEAVIHYVNLDQAFRLSGARTDLLTASEIISAPARANIEALMQDYNALTAQLNSPVLSPNGRTALNRQRDAKATELEAAMAANDNAVEAFVSDGESAFRLELINFITSGEIASDADIVHLYSAELSDPGAVYVANLDLDITQSVAEALGSKSNLEP